MTALAYIGGSVLLIPAWFRKPINAVYVLFASALLFEIFPLDYPDSLTDQVLVFLNLNNAKVVPSLGPIAISAAEVLMALGLAAWFFFIGEDGERLRPTGRILAPYAAFVVVVFLAEIRGMLSGGDFLTSLWELRPQVYGFIMFLLAASLIRERSHLRVLATIFFSAVALKVLIADFRYFVTLGANLGSRESVMSHEESYFYALFAAAAAAFLVWRGRDRRLLALLPLALLAVLAETENRRRVGVVALWLSIALVFVLGIRFEPHARKWLVVTGAILAVVASSVTVVYWDHPAGAIGQLVRPIRTQIQPDTSGRDARSDAYRMAEDLNLIATYDTSPVVGVGFGRPMLYIYKMADISQIYYLWNYIPHNTILWIAMRMGVVGMLAFWGLVGMVLLEAMHFMRTSTSRALRGVAAFAVIAVLAELVMAWGDLQLENYRNMIVFGVMAGIVDALPRVDRVDA